MIGIFDMSTVNAIRYNSELIRNPTAKLCLLVDDRECFDGSLITELPNVVQHICTSYWGINKLSQTFRTLNISKLIISGQRIADYRVILAARLANVELIYKMHGLYVEYMPRDLFFFITKIEKSIRTLWYLTCIGWYLSSFIVPFGMLFSFLFGLKRKAWFDKSPLFQVDKGVIWSEYWASWHFDNWSMCPKFGWLNSGNPDSTKFTIVNKPNGVGYIYQTLVEDGRIPKEVMLRFYTALLTFSKTNQLNVYVKWHPRGSLELKAELQHLGFIISDELVVCDINIGHYSSLMGLLPLINKNIWTVELEGHSTPQSILSISSRFFYGHDIENINLNGYNLEFDNKYREASIFYFGDFFDSTVESNIIFDKLSNF
jgi:hypothetical protein